MLRRAMVMKPPQRVVKDKPTLTEREYKEKLQKDVEKNRQRDKNRRIAECPYACGWSTNYKYKKQVMQNDKNFKLKLSRFV